MSMSIPRIHFKLQHSLLMLLTLCARLSRTVEPAVAKLVKCMNMR